jgi:hypothetical protein
MSKSSRIQSLIIKHLQKFGSLDIKLPDGMDLEIGITEQTKDGEVKSKDYCWALIKRDDRTTSLDRYSLWCSFDHPTRKLVDNTEKGIVYIF